MGFLLFIFAFSRLSLALEPSDCDKISAEFREMERLSPKNCEEARQVHKQFQLAYAEVNQQCRRLESRVAAGATKLKLGTEDEMRLEATLIRQQDMSERFTLTERISHELLLTPIDTDSPARPPQLVAEECRDELDSYAKIRRQVLSVFSRLFQQIDTHDDSLFAQAAERALPSAPRAPSR